jgi:acyl-CoA reductase-like NAD-dependent aldehyde dehydrogenase
METNLNGKMLVGGEWVVALNGATGDVINPGDESVIGQIPWGGAAECDQAIRAASQAFRGWSKSNPFERAAILEAAANLIRVRVGELAALTTRESGKLAKEAQGEWLAAANLFTWFAEQAKTCDGRMIPSRNPARSLHVVYQPMGVIGVITAWNFPAYNPARSWAAALAAGCTVVAKPSELTPFSAIRLGELLSEAGLPQGVLNIVMGDAKAIGDTMMAAPAVRKVSFTGSLAVGKQLMTASAQTCTQLSLELGGNGPVIIHSDVDVDAVAQSAVAAKFRNCGQVCVSPQRFFVHADIMSKFVAKVSAIAASLNPGIGSDAASEVGPMISKVHRERVEAYVRRAKDAGGIVRCGGEVPKDARRGYFFSPTVIEVVDEGQDIWQQEIFGPVMTVSSYHDIASAVGLVNASEYGLAAYVFAKDVQLASHIAANLEAGMVGINDWYPQSIEGPFGGWKQSGIGRECGREGLHEYLQIKVISHPTTSHF